MIALSAFRGGDPCSSTSAELFPLQADHVGVRLFEDHLRRSSLSSSVAALVRYGVLGPATAPLDTPNSILYVLYVNRVLNKFNLMCARPRCCTIQLWTQINR